MDFTQSQRARETAERVRAFIESDIAPVEDRVLREIRARNHGGEWKRWKTHPVVEALKAKARAAGLWNLFMPGKLTTVEYASVAEATGHSLLAPEVFNCNAPDSGNMEVLHHFGTAEQKKQWLDPLLAGEVRSTFFMTEPEVASSDATNISATIAEDGDDLVLNGRKWWSTGVGHPDAKVGIFMGRSNPDNDRHHQHSMVLVPLNAKGLTIERMLPVFGDYDEPYGHGQVRFENVRVPKTNVIAGLGKGFEIAQKRLGPGRIHHCMRAIGGAERALALMITRGMSRVAFGKPTIDLGGNRERIAQCRIAIDQARLLTLHAAWKIDTAGSMGAMSEISAIKVVAPNVLQHVVDGAIQMHGGAGMSDDVPLTALFVMARALRIADGPDEVHLALIARRELDKFSDE